MDIKTYTKIRDKILELIDESRNNIKTAKNQNNYKHISKAFLQIENYVNILTLLKKCKSDFGVSKNK